MNYKVNNEIIGDKSLIIPSALTGFYNHTTYETTNKKGRRVYVFKGTYPEYFTKFASFLHFN